MSSPENSEIKALLLKKKYRRRADRNVTRCMLSTEHVMAEIAAMWS